MSFRLTPQAEADLAAISDYIGADNPAAARRLLDRFYECFGLLATFPQLGVSRDEVRTGLRLHPVGNYLILYRQIDTGVEVVRVVHGARQWRDLL
jgi:toxin ParE1/3/4